MSTLKPRTTITLDDELLNSVSDYFHQRRMRSQSQAIVSLIEAGLAVVKKSGVMEQEPESASKQRDPRRRKLLQMYDRLNNDGRKRLVEYADDLCCVYRYVRDGDGGDGTMYRAAMSDDDREHGVIRHNAAELERLDGAPIVCTDDDL